MYQQHPFFPLTADSTKISGLSDVYPLSANRFATPLKTSNIPSPVFAETLYVSYKLFNNANYWFRLSISSGLFANCSYYMIDDVVDKVRGCDTDFEEYKLSFWSKSILFATNTNKTLETSISCYIWASQDWALFKVWGLDASQQIITASHYL